MMCFWLFGSRRPFLFALACHIQVKESIHKRVADLTAWSMTYAGMGMAPTAGFDGETFEATSFRAEMAGKELAGGFRKLGTLGGFV